MRKLFFESQYLVTHGRASRLLVRLAPLGSLDCTCAKRRTMPRIFCPDLSRVFENTHNRFQSPRAQALRYQMGSSGRKDTKHLQLPLVDIEVYDEQREVRHVAVPGEIMQYILVLSFWFPLPTRDVRLTDSISTLRSTSKGFYLIILDMWPVLQEKFFDALYDRLSRHEHKVGQVIDHVVKPKNVLFDRNIQEYIRCVTPGLSMKDVEIAGEIISQGETFMHAINERVNVLLRSISYKYLMCLAINEYTATFAEEPSLTEEVYRGIPTLTGFAKYISSDNSKLLQDIKEIPIDQFVARCLEFYRQSVPDWNMISVDDESSPSLNDYLSLCSDNFHLNVHQIRLEQQEITMMDAFDWPSSLVWPPGRDYDSIRHAFDICKDKLPYFSPLATFYELFVNDQSYTLFASLTLPIRSMRHRRTTPDIYMRLVNSLSLPFNSAPTECHWSKKTQCITVNITTGMIRNIITGDDYSASFFTSETLPDDGGLDADNMNIFADIILSRAGGVLFNNSVISNFMFVYNTIVEEIGIESCSDVFQRHAVIESESEWTGTPMQCDWGDTMIVGSSHDFEIIVDPDLLKSAEVSPDMSFSPTFCLDLRPMTKIEIPLDPWAFCKRYPTDTITSQITSPLLDFSIRASDLLFLAYQMDISSSKHMFNLGLKKMTLTQSLIKPVSQRQRRRTGKLSALF